MAARLQTAIPVGSSKALQALMKMMRVVEASSSGHSGFAGPRVFQWMAGWLKRDPWG